VDEGSVCSNMSLMSQWVSWVKFDMVLLVIADKNNRELDILAVWSADLCVFAWSNHKLYS